jgi:hypothetical protein
MANKKTTKAAATKADEPDVQPDPDSGEFTEPPKAALTSTDVTDLPEGESEAVEEPVAVTAEPVFIGDLSAPETEAQEAEPPAAPIVEDGPGDFVIGSRRRDDLSTYAADSDVTAPTEAEPPDEEAAKDYEEVSEARFVGWNLYIIGEGFHAPGEVIIDVARAGGGDHQRFSAWTDDGNVDTPVPGINGVGAWEIRLEQVVTQVGEGNEDGLPTVLTTEPRQLEMY